MLLPRFMEREPGETALAAGVAEAFFEFGRLVGGTTLGFAGREGDEGADDQEGSEHGVSPYCVP